MNSQWNGQFSRYELVAWTGERHRMAIRESRRAVEAELLVAQGEG